MAEQNSKREALVLRHLIGDEPAQHRDQASQITGFYIGRQDGTEVARLDNVDIPKDQHGNFLAMAVGKCVQNASKPAKTMEEVETLVKACVERIKAGEYQVPHTTQVGGGGNGMNVTARDTEVWTLAFEDGTATGAAWVKPYPTVQALLEKWNSYDRETKVEKRRGKLYKKYLSRYQLSQLEDADEETDF